MRNNAIYLGIALDDAHGAIWIEGRGISFFKYGVLLTFEQSLVGERLITQYGSPSRHGHRAAYKKQQMVIPGD